MSTSSNPNSLRPERSLIVVGSRPKNTGTTDGNGPAKSAAVRAIFSSVVLKTESQGEYDSLVSGLREACQPQGTLEEVLVEKITAILWRYRRLITAESSEIAESSSPTARSVAHLRERDRMDLEYLHRRRSGQGVIALIYDPEILKACINTLSDLRDNITRRGFRKHDDQARLCEIYGQRINVWDNLRDRYVEPNLLDIYDGWERTSKVTEEERQKHGYASPERLSRESTAGASGGNLQADRVTVTNPFSASRHELLTGLLTSKS